MDGTDQAEADIVVRGERCKVVARKSKNRWGASGTFQGILSSTVTVLPIRLSVSGRELSGAGEPVVGPRLLVAA